MAQFHNSADYLDWCESIVTKIYYANIAVDNEAIKKAVAEVASTLHMSEGQYLFDGGDLESTDAEIKDEE
jgi:hypothetical protein